MHMPVQECFAWKHCVRGIIGCSRCLQTNDRLDFNIRRSW